MKYNSFQRDFCFIINSNDSMIAEEEVGKVRSAIKKNGTEGGYNGNLIDCDEDRLLLFHLGQFYNAVLRDK